MLAPVLAEFSQKQLKVIVELHTDSRFFSLLRREANLVFRIKSFEDPEIITRRLIHIEYAAYVASGSAFVTNSEGVGAAPVTMDTASEDTSDASGFGACLPRRTSQRAATTRTSRPNSVLPALGIAVLPDVLGDAMPGLERLDLGEVPPGRNNLIGYHRDLKRLSRLSALLNLVIERLAN